MSFIYKGVLKEEFLHKMMYAFETYKSAKYSINEKIKNNNRWFTDVCDEVKKDEGGLRYSVTSKYIFNAIANKHADAMDNYPIPNLIPREAQDEETARVFSGILPVIMDRAKFRRTYSRNWWYKLINGSCCYGVFWDEDIKDIKIEKIDLLNLYWQPDITDLQKSKYVFFTTLVDIDTLKEQYPQHREHIRGVTKIEKHYGEDGEGTHQPSQLAEVVSCYYKKRGNQVHLVKFNGNLILAASEDEDSEVYSELLKNGIKPQTKGGIYDHGKYPFVLDVLYPYENSPLGFGIVDIAKNQQAYIDKLNEVILKNALIAGKKRFAIKDKSGLNENELRDYENDIVHVSSDLATSYREIDTKPLDGFVINHRDKIINEMKEITGNRDFQQGATSGGVTAYGAIVALQQAGEKLSRDMIGESYEAVGDIVELGVELIRQFYDEENIYRITGENGGEEYVTFSNGDLMRENSPVMFDLDIVPQKENPFSREANNQLMIQLWSMGAFNPQNAPAALMLLECMNFDGKEKLMSSIRQAQEEQQQQIQQGQPSPAGVPGVRDLGNGYSEIDIGAAEVPSPPPAVRDLGNGYSEIDPSGLII